MTGRRDGRVQSGAPVVGSRSRSCSEDGVALVEFALVLPVFVLLLMSLIDFGLVFGGYTALRNGVQAGARLASVNSYNTGDCSGTPQQEMVCAVAARVGATVAGTTNQGVSMGIEVGNGAVGADDVVVCEKVNLKSATGITGFILNGRTLVSESRIRLESPLSFTSFTSGSVTYAGETITGMTCP